MDGTNAAEWILRRVVSPQLASELVGDQLEATSGKANMSFWLSIVGLAVAFSWRNIVGLVIAVVMGISAWYPWARVMIYRMLHGHLATEDWVTASNRYLGYSMLLWTAAGFSLVRFGLRSGLTQLSAIAALVATAAACFLWLPYAPHVFPITAILLFFFQMSSYSRRRSLAALSIVLAVGWLDFQIIERIYIVWHRLLPTWSLLLAFVSVPLVVASAMLFCHKHLIEGHRLETSSS
jgi:hypothetical protein